MSPHAPHGKRVWQKFSIKGREPVRELVRAESPHVYVLATAIGEASDDRLARELTAELETKP